VSNETIKSALRSAQTQLRDELSGLNEEASGYRDSLRYHQERVRSYKTSLYHVNRRKAKIRRELRKSEAVLYDISPVKNLHKGEQ
jgi:chromosome segregation ATPase